MDKARTVVESTLIPHTAFQIAMQRIKQALAYSLQSPEPVGIALVGEARTGKSRALEEADALLTRTRTSEGAVVPILRMRTPARPTVKGVASLLLKAMGDPKWEKGSETSMTVRLIDLIAQCQTQMLMLDEFQHFFDKGTHKIFHEVADWLKILMDETRVAVVVSGLEGCLPVLLQNEQLSGRFLAPIFMRRFHWLEPDGMAEFLGILEAFHIAMSEHFDMPELHRTEMAFRLWCASGGLIGHLAKLLRQAVWDTCDAGKRSITLEGFRAAHAFAAWSEFGDAVTVSPFDRSFSVEPTQEKIAQALTIGTCEVEVEAPTRGRPKKGTGPTLNQVLTGSGA